MRKRRRLRLAASSYVKWPLPVCFLLTICWLLLMLLSQVTASGRQEYYVTLPRLGHISGLLLRDNNPEVAAFLGIPYAAPPTGLLRFMPPGGLSSKAAAAATSAPELRTLEPSGQRAQVRPLRSFKHSCPKLSDWLPDQQQQQRNKVNVENQSEDCLNANLFVPLPLSTTHHPSGRYQDRSSSYQKSNKNLQDDNKRSVAKVMSQQTRNEEANRDFQWTTTTATAQRRSSNLSADGNEEEQLLLNQDNHSSNTLKPLPLRRLPVLVLIHSQVKEANSVTHAKLAHKMNALVVTFNFRLGLLGFLPFADDANQAELRNNHAIWDQLGLLFWLRHNVAHFGADPTAITLLPADNQALQLAQLLTLSPQAKGLFKRALLVYDQRQTGPSPAHLLSNVWRSANEARELRRRLTALLSSAVQSELTSSDQSTLPVVTDYIRSANLSQLALIERRLIQTASDKLLAFATAPTLDDKQLFGNAAQQLREQLSSIVAPVNADHQNQHHLLPVAQLNNKDYTNPSNLTLQRAELDYCLYMRQLYAGGLDPIGLLSASQRQPTTNRTNLPATHSGGWHHQEVNYTQKGRARRAQIASTFNHLQRLHLLNHLLQLSSSSQRLDDSSYLNESSSVPERDLFVEKAQTTVSKININDNRLQLQSFDLMLGHLWPESAQTGDSLSSLGDDDTLTIYPNMVKHLNAKTSNSSGEANYLSEHLLALLKMADFHFSTSYVDQAELLTQICDFTPTTKGANFTWRHSSSFVFVKKLNNVNSQLEEQNSHLQLDWLLDERISRDLSEFKNFINTGNPNGYSESSNLWQPYTTLNRHIKRFKSSPMSSDLSQSEDVEQLHNQILFRLDALPYLSFMSAISNRSLASNVTNLTRVPSFNNNLDAIATDDRLSDLITCLGELEIALSRSSKTDHLAPEELRCLSSSLATHRNQLRQFAADDLEPLVRWTRQQQQQQQVTAEAQQPHSLSSVASITTRNLISDESSSSSANDTTQTAHLESSSFETSEINNSTLIFVRNATALSSTTSTPTTHLSPNIHTFLSKTYRDAAARPLLMVLGGGLSILLLNLVIVAIIALRAAQARRQLARRQVIDPDSCSSPNQQQVMSSSGEGTFLNNQQQTSIQLTSSLKRQSSSRCRHKQLKFKLEGSSHHELPATCVAHFDELPEQAHLNCTYINEDVSGLNLISQQENINQQEEQQQFTYSDIQPAPLLLSAAPLLEADDQYASQLMHQLLPCGYANNTWTTTTNHHQLHDEQSTTLDLCSSGIISAPIMNDFNSTLNKQQQSKKKQLARQSQLQVNNIHCHNHSIASPSSSTTVSLTPIQLGEQSAGISHCNGLNSFNSPQYQLKPIGLLYETTEQTVEGEEKTMFLVENTQNNAVSAAHLVDEFQSTFSATNSTSANSAILVDHNNNNNNNCYQFQ